MTWSRDTHWRQGHVLPEEAILHIDDLPDGIAASNAVAVVVTHDCDLANDNLEVEPNAEIVLGRRIERVNGSLTHAKSSRRLHLIFNTPQGEQAVELFATHKRFCCKNTLGQFMPLDWQLSNAEQVTLQNWLAARYRRSAFPDPFNNLLSEHKLDKKLAKILEPLGQTIVAVFFDLEEESDSLYRLYIDLLYDTRESPEAAEGIVQEAADKITAAFQKKLLKDDIWRGIELVSCDPLSDEALTYRHSQLLKQWRLDYLSLRDEPQQPRLEN